MDIVSRRQTLRYSTALAVAAAVGALSSQLGATVPPKITPLPTNLLGARAYIYTIVTPSLDASIGFYRDIMGFELVEQGQLGNRLPNLPGVGGAGRGYALIRTMDLGLENGILRLLEAPAGAKPARPRPETTIMDPGFAVIECHSRNVDDSYGLLVKSGVETITPPKYYFYDDLPMLPGAIPDPPFEFRSYSAYGPAGEQIFISSGVSVNHKPYPAWPYKGLHDGFTAGVMISRDRWPVWAFYDAVLGIKPTRDTYTGQENVNQLIGAKARSSFQFGMMGDGVKMEWWEYRDRPPSAKPPYPTDLDRTGLAMTTMVVNDLNEVRARVKATKTPILAEGTLPMPGKRASEGLFVRGPLGELLEIIGRDA